MRENPGDLGDWLDYISKQHSREIEMGLSRLQRVREKLRLPELQCPVITVAGTNGKGSSIRALEALYTRAGYRTGCYTSPHLTVFNERIRVCETFASAQDICTAFSSIEDARGDIPLTYFEFATLAAMLIFSGSDLDIVLLEVGLGGRLDATNLVPADLALITSISLDHTDWLGNDLETIGYEKAGIIHPGKIAVISDPSPPRSVLDAAAGKASRYFLAGRDFNFGLTGAGWWWKHDQELLKELPKPGLQGCEQYENLAGVLMCVTALQQLLPVAVQVIREVIPSLRLAGRYQVIEGKPLLVLDVAHNPASVAQLAKNLREDPVAGETHAVVAMLKDKDIRSSLQEMLPAVDHWYASSLDVGRGETAANLSEILAGVGENNMARIYSTPVQALKSALSNAKSADRVVVFGSFHTVGAIIEYLSDDRPEMAALS